MSPGIGSELDNLFTPEAAENPYAIYRTLRETSPVHWNPLISMWIVTRYEDVFAALQDPRFSSAWVSLRRFARELDADEQAAFAHFTALFARMMVWQDDPAHARQRAIVHKAFTPRTIARIADEIQRLVDQLIDAVEAKGRFEAVADLAVRLPATVIFVLCGVPEDLRPSIFASVKAQFEAFGAIDPAPGQLVELARIQRASEVHVLRLIAERRANPQDDLLSLLATAEDDGQFLSEDELCSFVYMLIAAGYDTTTNAIANALLTLVRHPEQLAQLRAHPDLIESAIEECVRYEGPVLGVLRATREEVVIGGTLIPAGQMVMLMVGSANRDLAYLPDADRFDITRPLSRQLGFGYGTHYCLGAPLARLELRIALTTVLRRLPDVRLAADRLEWLPNLNFHTLKALPLDF